MTKQLEINIILNYADIFFLSWFCSKFPPENFFLELSWRFVCSDNMSSLSRAGGVSALFITERPFYYSVHWNNHRRNIYLQFNIIHPAVFSCVGKVQLRQHESFVMVTARKHNILPKTQENKIIISNCWFRLLEKSSPC